MKKYTLLVLLSSLLLTSCGNEAKQNAKNIVPVVDDSVGAPLTYEDACYYAVRAGINILNAKSVTVNSCATNSKAWYELYDLGFNLSSYTSTVFEGSSSVNEKVMMHENGYSIEMAMNETFVDPYGLTCSADVVGVAAVILENINSKGESGSFDFSQYIFESSNGYDYGDYSSTKMTYSSASEFEMIKYSILVNSSRTISSILAQFDTGVYVAYDMGDYYHILNDYNCHSYTISNPNFNAGDLESTKNITLFEEEYSCFDVYKKDNDYYLANYVRNDELYICEDLEGNMLEEPVLLNSYYEIFTVDSYEIVPFVENENLLICKKLSKVPYTLLLTPSGSGSGYDVCGLDNPYCSITKSYNIAYPDNKYDVYGINYELFAGDALMFVTGNDLLSGNTKSIAFEFEDRIYGEDVFECVNYEATETSPSYTRIEVKEDCEFGLLLFVDSETNELVKVKTHLYDDNFEEMTTN